MESNNVNGNHEVYQISLYSNHRPMAVTNHVDGKWSACLGGIIQSSQNGGSL